MSSLRARLRDGEPLRTLTPAPHVGNRIPIALCLGGLSPAVVSETLFALAVRRPLRIVPREVHIITTQGSYTALVAALLGPGGALARLRNAYRLPKGSLVCTTAHVHVMTGADGVPLDDIQNEGQSVDAGAFIAGLVRRLAEDPTTELHCSLAGGRKTMSALLATALQLHGRPHDRLYHVLVNEPFERVPEFFFPPRPAVRYRVDGRLVDSRRARVTLIEVPIVRLGAAVRLLGYDGLAVERIARELQVDAAGRLVPDPLRVSVGNRRLSVGPRDVKLPPQEVALFALYAAVRAACRNAGCRDGGRCARCHLTDDEVHDRRFEIAGWYELAAGSRRETAVGRLLTAAAHDAQQLSDFRAWLQQTRSRLNRRLVGALGRGPGGRRYAVTALDPERNGRRRRGLLLAPRFISVRERDARRARA